MYICTGGDVRGEGGGGRGREELYQIELNVILSSFFSWLIIVIILWLHCSILSTYIESEHFY
jgi:hypothetical protein